MAGRLSSISGEMCPCFGLVLPTEWPLYLLKTAGCSDGGTITSTLERGCERREGEIDRRMDSFDSLDSCLTRPDTLVHACHSSQPRGGRLCARVRSDFSIALFHTVVLADCSCKKSPARHWITHLLPLHSDSRHKQPRVLSSLPGSLLALLRFLMTIFATPGCANRLETGVTGKWDDGHLLGRPNRLQAVCLRSREGIMSLLLAKTETRRIWFLQNSQQL